MEKQIFGATDGIRAKVGEAPLRPNMVRHLGEAIAKHFAGGKILIGRDTRASGSWMRAEVVEGIHAAHGDVEEADILPTPALQVLTDVREDVKAGIMLTASHNPATDNGLKVFNANGEKLSDEEELEIEKIYFEDGPGEDKGMLDSPLRYVTNSVAVEQYAEFAERALGINYDLDGAHLVLDAACGAGHDFSRKVFDKFRIEVEQIDPEPDGHNINDGYGALYPEKMAEKVKELGYIGVAFDGDADRIILADETGRIWDGDRIVILIAEYLQEKNMLPNNRVVLTEYSNLATLQYLTYAGIAVDKVVNGDRFVTQKCLELGAGLGGELSGHIILLPWLNSSDATFITLLVQKIVREKGCRLADLWAKYDNLPSRQWGINVVEKKQTGEIPGFDAAVKAAEERFGGDGRVFCRYSGTENKLRILVEGKDAILVDEIGEELAGIVRKEIGA